MVKLEEQADQFAENRRIFQFKEETRISETYDDHRDQYRDFKLFYFFHDRPPHTLKPD